jgi:hypothetical protein
MKSDTTPTGTAPYIVSTEMDRTSQLTRLYRSDGMIAEFPLEMDAFDKTSRISKARHFVRTRQVEFETTQGERIVAELPALDDLSPVAGRPVVYLDQKDWSTVANSIYSPDKVPPQERAAALRLIEFARKSQVVLPLSSAHMSETCKWSKGDSRYRLALTILQLSAGWQMRDPLDVRRTELNRSFRQTTRGEVLGSAPTVVTLEPNVIHGATRGRAGRHAPDDFPPDAALALEALTSLSGTFDTMLDADPVAMTATPKWVAKNARFSAWLSKETARTATEKAACAEALFFADTAGEIAEEAHEAGISPLEMSAWVMQNREAEIARMPSLGLFRETFIVMHLNHAQWEDNHLTDLMYLTCAAGYADFVVAEKSLVGYMRQGLGRLGRPQNVYRRIQDVIPLLEKELS